MATTQIKNGFHGGTDDQLLVNPDGSINVNTTGGGATTTNLTEVGGSPITLGQTTEANSIPVTIASDQSPIPITGSITATNPSVGPTGTTAPTQATEIGAVDSSGNLQHLLVDPSGKLLVDISGTSTVTGTVNADIVGLGAFQTSQYTIGATAIQLAPTPLVNRSSISITIEASPNVAVYIGNSSAVTISTGYPLYDGSTIQLDLTPAGNVWAITATAGQTACVLEMA